MSADARRRLTGRYSLLVVEDVDDGWRVTQDGVAVVGRGRSAPLAAADYCRRVAEVGDGDD